MQPQKITAKKHLDRSTDIRQGPGVAETPCPSDRTTGDSTGDHHCCRHKIVQMWRIEVYIDAVGHCPRFLRISCLSSKTPGTSMLLRGSSQQPGSGSILALCRHSPVCGGNPGILSAGGVPAGCGSRLLLRKVEPGLWSDTRGMISTAGDTRNLRSNGGCSGPGFQI